MDITTTTAVPLPESRSAPKYPWKTMEIGDSFEVPAEVKKEFTGQVSSASRRFNKKFVTRTVDGVTRVWRTE